VEGLRRLNTPQANKVLSKAGYGKLAGPPRKTWRTFTPRVANLQVA
jgi:hypothetical protein